MTRTKSSTTTVAVLGAGGYGWIYVRALLDGESAATHGVRLIAAVEPNPHAAEPLAFLKAHGVPVYATPDELYAEHRPNVVVIASPIQHHCRQTIDALARGCHVLCEKPLAATADQAEQMRRAAARSACQVAVGYQWSFSPAIQALKADILAGRFGQPRRARSLVLWPRDEAYYARNGWAGRRATVDGLAVHDSPINNACAHSLHNLLYLLGPRVDRSATPAAVTAELYRAHPIETFDTAAVRARTHGNVDLLMIASHATAEVHEPVFEIQFDGGTASYSADGTGRLGARMHDGRSVDYGRPSSSTDVDKLWSSVAAFRSGEPVLCGIEAALPQALAVSAAEASMPQPCPFPRSFVRVSGTPGERRTEVAGLGEVLLHCYDQWALPNEVGAAWASRGTTVRVDGPTDVDRGDRPVGSAATRAALQPTV